jgi:beta-lactam-binding protein with PASTA domain
MSFRGRFAALGITALLTACLLASCGSGPTAAQRKAVRDILTTTTTKPPPTTAAPSSTTTSQPGVAIPNVIGLKIAAARAALRAAGFTSVNLNTPCNKGTLASQSVVVSLAIPGKAPNVTVGAVPLAPGVTVAPRTRLGITWSGCVAGTPEVPAVVGLSFAAARQALHGVGLTWACFSVGKPATTTTTHAHKDASTSVPSTTTTTTPPVTATTVKVVQTVLTQSPAPHTVLQPGATVTLTMHHCPQ